MKLQSFTRIMPVALVAAVAMTILTRANAQQIAMNIPVENNSALLKENKIPHEPSTITGESSSKKVNLHAQKDFALKYKNVNNASWYVLEGGAIARFMSGDITTSVIYNKNGGWLQTISCY